MIKTEFTNKKRVANVILMIVTWFFRIMMFIYALSLIFPILWMIINSFKGYQEIYVSSSLAFPKTVVIENYVNIFDKLTYTVYVDSGKIVYDIWAMAYYSLIYALGKALFQSFIYSIVAYAIARYKNWLTKLLFSLGMALMLIPFTSDGGTGLLLYKKFGIYNNLLAYILVSAGGAFSGGTFLMLKACFDKLGMSYADAASLDGAGQFTIMVKIIFPLASPLLSAILITSFIGSWNDYGTFLLMLPSYANLALGMYEFQREASLNGATYPEVLAGFVIVAIPIVIMFSLTHKLISRNLSLGGLKE